MTQFILLLVFLSLLVSCNDNLQKNDPKKTNETKIESTIKPQYPNKDSLVPTKSDSIIQLPMPEVVAAADHSKFSTFWVDFKAAVLSKNVEAVFKLTSMPFDDSNDIFGKANSLTTKNKKQFLINYSKIFNPCVVKAIKNNKYYSWEGCEDCMMQEPKLKGDYILSVQHNCNERALQDLAFKKIKGKFMLHRIQYMP